MHIGFLTPEYPHKETGKSGGLGTSIKNLAAGLLKEGVEISIFIYGQEKDKIITDRKLKLHLIQQRRYPLFTWWFYRKFLQDYLNRHIREEQIDLIEAPDWTGITTFINLKVPLVIRMNGSDGYFCFLEKRRQKIKNRFFERRALVKADYLASVSKFTAQITNKVFKLNREIIVIPNGIDVSKFKPAHSKINLKEVLYFGSLIRKKGVLELAGIFNELCELDGEVQLTLLGKDVKDIFEKRSTIELFKERVDVKNLYKIKWYDEMPYEEVSKMISRSQVIVLPSFAEALPMTWLEAMAMEKAVVTSDIGWAEEVMEDGITGFTVAPVKHKLFARKIKELIDDPQLAKHMGRNARQRVLKKFSKEVVVDKNMELYSKICQKS